MSGKIKEILEALKSHNDIIKEYPLTLSIEEQKLLLDYITNLQDEIERLNNIINKGKIYCEDVIQEHENGEYNVSTTQLAIEEHKKNIISLLNILNGDLENYWRSDK